MEGQRQVAIRRVNALLPEIGLLNPLFRGVAQDLFAAAIHVGELQRGGVALPDDGVQIVDQIQVAWFRALGHGLQAPHRAQIFERQQDAGFLVFGRFQHADAGHQQLHAVFRRSFQHDVTARRAGLENGGDVFGESGHRQ